MPALGHSRVRPVAQGPPGPSTVRAGIGVPRGSAVGCRACGWSPCRAATGWAGRFPGAVCQAAGFSGPGWPGQGRVGVRGHGARRDPGIPDTGGCAAIRRCEKDALERWGWQSHHPRWARAGVVPPVPTPGEVRRVRCRTATRAAPSRAVLSGVWAVPSGGIATRSASERRFRHPGSPDPRRVADMPGTRSLARPRRPARPLGLARGPAAAANAAGHPPTRTAPPLGAPGHPV